MGSKGTRRAGKNWEKGLQKFGNLVQNFISQLGKNRKNSQLLQERENIKTWDFPPLFLLKIVFSTKKSKSRGLGRSKKFGNKLIQGKGWEKLPK